MRDASKRCSAEIEKSQSEIIHSLSKFRGFDIQDPNLSGTPTRVAKALIEITEGSHQMTTIR